MNIARISQFVCLFACLSGAAVGRAESPAPMPERMQLSVLAGLLQPTVLRGFNTALDVRYRRFVFNYSHGAALDYSAAPRLTLSAADRRANLSLRAPWSTGFGLGATLVDELYLLLDFKVHRYEAQLGVAEARYTTVSLGAELGYRWFVWRGLFLNPTVRYWPNVWTSAKNDRVLLRDGDQSFSHRAKDLGVFGNVSIGIAFTP